MPDWSKIFKDVDKVDMIKLLKLIYNNPLTDEVDKIYAGNVDESMLAWLQEKACHCFEEQQHHTDAWIDFLLCLDHDYLQIVVEYVNELII